MRHSPKHLAELHKKRHKKAEHKLVLAASVIYPLTTIPQIYEIFSAQSAGNVSLATYAGYMLFAFIFLYYGVSEKLQPVIVLQVLWIIMYVPVVIGILLYG